MPALFVDKKSVRNVFSAILGFLLFHFTSSVVLAQPAAGAVAKYPTKPVRIIVGFSPGGGIDTIARIAAKNFSGSFGQQFIVDNRPGASGTIAADMVAKAVPDGHVLLMTADVHTITPGIFDKLPYDPVKDFAPVGTFAGGPQCIAAHPSLPVQSLRDLIFLSKRRPGDVSYASAGSGTLTHVAMELFTASAGIRLLHVPYKGSGSSILAAIGGEVPVISIALGQALTHAKQKKLRLLAVTSAKRTPLAPEIPTVAEAAGLPGYEAASWLGLLAPAGLSPVILNRLNAEIERQLQLPDVLRQFATRAWVPESRSPAGFADMVKSDVAKWSRVLRGAGELSK